MSSTNLFTKKNYNLAEHQTTLISFMNWFLPKALRKLNFTKRDFTKYKQRRIYQKFLRSENKFKMHRSKQRLDMTENYSTSFYIKMTLFILSQKPQYKTCSITSELIIKFKTKKSSLCQMFTKMMKLSIL